MAFAGDAVAAAAAAAHTSSYRVKFRRREFLELVQIAKPEIIYRRGKNHFFAFNGFVMYSQECSDQDFSQKVLESIELSNSSWQT
jgi:hypothetical protein